MQTPLSRPIHSLVSPRQIIAATDLTDGERLIPHITAQAKATGAHVSLVHALPIPDEVLLGGVPGRDAADIERYGASVLRAMAATIKRSGVECSVTIKTGIPEEVVQAEIVRTGATRLIIGTHGHVHSGQRIIGTIANSLIRSIAIPVLVIGPHLEANSYHMLPHSILHPVSLTGRYRDSAGFALKFARAYGADLTFIHILDSSILRGSYVRELFDDAEGKLESLIPKDSLTVANTVVETGDPVLQILELSERISADWIVMSIEHDLPWWSMRNNTTYQVIAGSSCPVLVFRSRTVAAEVNRTNAA
jgi:nucleotide-binding universal stress UspA family protein